MPANLPLSPRRGQLGRRRVAQPRMGLFSLRILSPARDLDLSWVESDLAGYRSLRVRIQLLGGRCAVVPAVVAVGFFARRERAECPMNATQIGDDVHQVVVT